MIAISSGSCIRRKFPPKQKIWNMTLHHDLSFAAPHPISSPFCLRHLSSISFWFISPTSQRVGPENLSHFFELSCCCMLPAEIPSGATVWGQLLLWEPSFFCCTSLPYTPGVAWAELATEDGHCPFSSSSQSSFGIRKLLITLSGNRMLSSAR